MQLHISLKCLCFTRNMGIYRASQVVLVVKNPPANAGDMGSIPVLGQPLAGGHGNPLQSSCLENLMDSGGWWTIVPRVTMSQTRLKWLSRQAREYIKVKISRNWIVGLEALLEKVPLMGDFGQLHLEWEPWSSLKVALFCECWLIFISAAEHKSTDVWPGCISARLSPRMAQKLYANLKPTLEAHFSMLPETLLDFQIRKKA